MMKADHFSSDILEFIELLHEYQVQFLIVGGEAVIYYGYARLTGDVDFFYDRNAENVDPLFDALTNFWDGQIPGIDKKSDLIEKDYVIQFGVPPNRIDLLSSIEGVEFQEAWKTKSTEHISLCNKEIPVHFIGLNDLIANKEKAGRPKDLEDLKYLKNL